VKLKTIVILFNILVVATFLMVVLMPLFLLGPEYTRALRERIENYETKKRVISLKTADLI